MIENYELRTGQPLAKATHEVASETPSAPREVRRAMASRRVAGGKDQVLQCVGWPKIKRHRRRCVLEALRPTDSLCGRSTI